MLPFLAALNQALSANFTSCCTQDLVLMQVEIQNTNLKVDIMYYHVSQTEKRTDSLCTSSLGSLACPRRSSPGDLLGSDTSGAKELVSKCQGWRQVQPERALHARLSMIICLRRHLLSSLEPESSTRCQIHTPSHHYRSLFHRYRWLSIYRTASLNYVHSIAATKL